MRLSLLLHFLFLRLIHIHILLQLIQEMRVEWQPTLIKRAIRRVHPPIYIVQVQHSRGLLHRRQFQEMLLEPFLFLYDTSDFLLHVAQLDDLFDESELFVCEVGFFVWVAPVALVLHE